MSYVPTYRRTPAAALSRNQVSCVFYTPSLFLVKAEFAVPQLPEKPKLRTDLLSSDSDHCRGSRCPLGEGIFPCVFGPFEPATIRFSRAFAAPPREKSSFDSVVLLRPKVESRRSLLPLLRTSEFGLLFSRACGLARAYGVSRAYGLVRVYGLYLTFASLPFLQPAACSLNLIDPDAPRGDNDCSACA